MQTTLHNSALLHHHPICRPPHTYSLTTSFKLAYSERPQMVSQRTSQRKLPAVPTESQPKRSKMSSSSDPKASKKRVGRKRKPPLPPGPPMQFVVANHPDQFKAGQTMRNVRSHVMYKHREQRGPSPGGKGKSVDGRRTPGTITRTPSPLATQSDGGVEHNEFNSRFLAPSAARSSNAAWDQDLYKYTSESPSNSPARDLAARIISATTASPARSAPPMFEDATQFPFPGSHIADPSSLDTLKQNYINTTEFFCHGRICSDFLRPS